MAFSNKNKFKVFVNRIYPPSPTMHGIETEYMKEACDTNWIRAVIKNVDEVERINCDNIGCNYAVALSCGT